MHEHPHPHPDEQVCLLHIFSNTYLLSSQSYSSAAWVVFSKTNKTMTSRLVSCSVTTLSKRIGQLNVAGGSNSFLRLGVSPLLHQQLVPSSSSLLQTIDSTTFRTQTTLVGRESSLMMISYPFQQQDDDDQLHHHHQHQQYRFMGSKSKADKKKDAAKKQQRTAADHKKTKKSAPAAPAHHSSKKATKKAKKAAQQKRHEDDSDSDEEMVAPQHEAWVDFQKELSIDGFQTGQTTTARTTKKGTTGYQLRDLTQREKTQKKLAVRTQELVDVSYYYVLLK